MLHSYGWPAPHPCSQCTVPWEIYCEDSRTHTYDSWGICFIHRPQFEYKDAYIVFFWSSELPNFYHDDIFNVIVALDIKLYIVKIITFEDHSCSYEIRSEFYLGINVTVIAAFKGLCCKAAEFIDYNKML